MTTKATCEREFSKLMAYHVLGNVNRDKFISVVNSNSMPYEIG